mgnify:FL=1
MSRWFESFQHLVSGSTYVLANLQNFSPMLELTSVFWDGVYLVHQMRVKKAL